VKQATIRRAALRRPKTVATSKQREEIVRLADLAGIETPRVFWSRDAEKVIKLLDRMVREPTLELRG